MATRYYLTDVNLDTTCDPSVAAKDLDKVRGAGATSASDSMTSGTYVNIMAFDLDVSGDSPGTGTHFFIIHINAAVDLTYRFRLVSVNSSCSIVNTSAWTADQTGAGWKTFPTMSLTWGTADRLRLEVQGFKNGGAGSKFLDVFVNDVDSYIDANWPVGGLSIPVAMNSYKQRRAA